MIHVKAQHAIEAMLIGIGLLQPISLMVLALPGALYYISMLKMNVVNKYHGGSWKQYVKSIFKL